MMGVSKLVTDTRHVIDGRFPVTIRSGHWRHGGFSVSFSAYPGESRLMRTLRRGCASEIHMDTPNLTPTVSPTSYDISV